MSNCKNLIWLGKYFVKFIKSANLFISALLEKVAVAERKYICFDCRFHNNLKIEDLGESDRCEHWRPEYWEAKGFRRNWGDAAIEQKEFEVLRKEEDLGGGKKKVIYVVLCPMFLRRPAQYYADSSIYPMYSWGSY